MNEIVPHIPPFVDVDEPRKSCSFDSLAQLLEIPFVRKFAETADFHRFSVSDRHMIAEYRGGRTWWVVGILRDHVDLPEWGGGIYEVFDSDGKPLEFHGAEVSYSCGDRVGLQDGRVLRMRR